MKTKRNNLNIICLLAVLFLSTTALAESFTVDELRYNKLSATTVEVVQPAEGKYSGDISIPKKVIYHGDAYQVTAIGDYAFQGASQVTSVTLPLTSIKSIGEYAFNDCTGLTEFTLPESITSIGKNAFYYCDKLQHLYVHSKNPASYNVGSNAFSNINRGGNVCTLHVPTGCTAAYAANASFSVFTKVEEFDPPVFYNLYVGGERVGADNASDILGNGAASYNAEKKTLTIKGDIDNDLGPCISNNIYGLTIEVAEPATLTSTGTALSLDANTTITGSSLLKVVSPDDYAAIFSNDADLTIVDAKLDVEGYIAESLGVGILTITNSSLTVKSEDGYSAILGWKDLVLNGCYIKSPVGGYFYEGYVAYDDDVMGDIASYVEISPGVVPTIYDLKVGGEKVTSDNASDILGDGAASYDAKKNTLTIKGVINNSNTSWAFIRNSIPGLTIEVAEPVTLTSTGTALSFNANTTITGSSLLKLISPKDDVAIFSNDADLTIVDAQLDVEGYIMENWEGGILTITNSSLTVKSEDGYSAILGWKDLVLNGCYIKSPVGSYFYEGYVVDDDNEYYNQAYYLEIVPIQVPNDLAFSEDKTTAMIGNPFTPPTLENPNKLPVTWKSSNEKVATVDQEGKVTLLTAGTTVITATFEGNIYFLAGSVSYELTVKEKIPHGLAFSKDEATARTGQTFTPPTLSNPNKLSVTWSSSDEKVAKINATTGEITLVTAGKTTITATFEGNEYYQAGSVSYVLTVFLTGDADGNGIINAADIVAIVNFMMGIPPVGFDEKSADINEDSEINIADIMVITKIIGL